MLQLKLESQKKYLTPLFGASRRIRAPQSRATRDPRRATLSANLRRLGPMAGGAKESVTQWAINSDNHG
jgi:hypothetical protein